MAISFDLFSVPFLWQAGASPASPAPAAASSAASAAQVDSRRVVLGGSEAVVWFVAATSSPLRGQAASGVRLSVTAPVTALLAA
jgi:hypothetical protein